MSDRRYPSNSDLSSQNFQFHLKLQVPASLPPCLSYRSQELVRISLLLACQRIRFLEVDFRILPLAFKFSELLNADIIHQRPPSQRVLGTRLHFLLNFFALTS